MILSTQLGRLMLMSLVLLGACLFNASAFQPFPRMSEPVFKSHSRVWNGEHHKPRISTTISMSSGPAVLDKPETIEVVKEDKTTEREEKIGGEGWEIRLFNDPFNKREFVARCLSTICGKSETESYQIMMQAHNHGMGVVGRYQFEIAELYYKSLSESGLMVDMVPVEDE